MSDRIPSKWLSVMESFTECKDLMKSQLIKDIERPFILGETSNAISHAFEIEARISPGIFLYRLLAHKKGLSKSGASKVALAFHCLHMAAHTIDDIIDDDDFRDRSPTVHAKFGKDVALLCGISLIYEGLNCLYQSLEDCSIRRYERAKAIRDFTECSMRVVEANYREFKRRKQIITVQEWEMLARQAVGSLLIGVWRITAHIIGSHLTLSLERACDELGIILRIFDDYYDMIGKQTDIRMGAPNLFLCAAYHEFKDILDKSANPSAILKNEACRARVNEIIKCHYELARQHIKAAIPSLLSTELDTALNLYVELALEILEG